MYNVVLLEHQDRNLELLYFNSPYYYQYTTGNQDDEYPFYTHKLPVLKRREIHNLLYVENNNQLFTISGSWIDVFDVYNMEWKSNKLGNGAVELAKSRRASAVCAVDDRVYISGGQGYEDVTHTVEMVNCNEVQDIDWDHSKTGLLSVILNSKMNCGRSSHGCDAIAAKGGIVVGGGGKLHSYNFYYKQEVDPSNTVEIYDYHKDIWTLLAAKTKHKYQAAKVWCSGNLIFITKIIEGHIGLMGTIEYVDIRDNNCRFDEIDKTMEKLFDFYRIKHKWSHYYQGLLI